MKIRIIKSKSILTKCGFPEDDYCINPYSGCLFGCSYCFADFMRRFSGHGKDEWGSYVDVKINAPELLVKELNLLDKRIQRGRDPKKPSVVIGSVTDPYQGVEAKYKITRKCLKVIAESNTSACFNILTKSNLVTRDIDEIKKIKNISVGITITTTRDKVGRLLEGESPPASQRLKALRKLNKAGISTYVCINPLLPHFSTNERSLRELLAAIQNTGNREVWFEHINLSGIKMKRIKEALASKAPNVIKYFENAKSKKYKSDLNKMIFKILKDYDFKIGGGGIIDHKRGTIIVENSKSNLNLKKGWKVEGIRR